MFKENDKVILTMSGETCRVLAVVPNGEDPEATKYVVQSLDGTHTAIVFEDTLEAYVDPAAEFKKLGETAKQFRLMQTMQRCQEVFDILEIEGKIDSEKIGSIDWYDESAEKIDLCREYEETYCNTDAYEENYTDSTESFFRVKLLEKFGKPQMKVFQGKITEEYNFFVKANSIDDVYEYLYAHENDDMKDYLNTDYVALDKGFKASEYHGQSYNISAILQEGGVQ